MKNGTIGNILVLILIASAAAIGLTNYYAEVTTNYNTNTSNFTNTTFVNKSKNITDMGDSMKAKIENSNVSSIPIIGGVVQAVDLGKDAVSLSFQTIDLGISLVGALTIAANGYIPGFAVALTIAAITIIIALTIFGIIIRYQLI